MSVNPSVKAVSVWVLGVALLAAGCSGNSAVVGKWKGSIDADAAKADSSLAGLADKFAETVNLEIKPDKTFKMQAVIMPVEGTWTFSGGKLTLQPTEVLGYATEAKKQAMEFTLSADKKQLVPVDPGSANGPGFTLVRDSG